MEDNQSDSYDEAKLQSLRKQLQVSKSELLELAYNEQKLNDKIDHLNSQGCACIALQQFYEAMIYLQEAQKILQYAAGCGRTIDRPLIIATLHNQATVYQRIWELARSADYIEAIIYNVNAFLSSQSSFNFTPEAVDPKSQQHAKFAVYLGNKINLIVYLLQFCAVSSQIKNHMNALNSAQKALSHLKTFCQELSAYQKLVGISALSDFEKSLLPQLQNIRDFQNEEGVGLQENIDKLLSKAHKSILMFQKKLEGQPAGVSKLELKELEGFSLGQLMQVSPVQLKKVQERLDLQLQLTLVRKIYKAIYISITHFTMATELRLIANERYGVDSTYKTQSKQFKQSQIHHLVAVITVALYVPCYTKYFEHILKSFMNHYQIDLAQARSLSQEEEYQGSDLVHLEIQSISQRDSDLSQPRKINENPKVVAALPKKELTRKTDKSSLLGQADRTCNRTTVHDSNTFGSPSSSQNSNLKSMNRTGLDSRSHKSGKKGGKSKSKKKSQQTQREKRIIIMEKVTSKSRSKGKNDSFHRRSKSSKKGQDEQEEEKVVHYFQYDNYSHKRVVKKSNKMHKQIKEPSDLLKRAAKNVRDKKSPEGMIATHLKRLKAISQSNKNLGSGGLKKGKSPELSTSRAPEVKKQK